MAEPLTCPHCDKLLTDEQVATLYGRMCNARRRVKSGGKNGGRRKPGAEDWLASERSRNQALSDLCERSFALPTPPRQPEAREDATGYPERILAPFEDL